jgi:uncharacterized repeat protein (TIGR01451 family)
VSSSTANSIVNTIIVNSSTPDPDFSNNSDTEIASVTPADTYADLCVSKEVSQTQAQAGDLLLYTIVVWNMGPDSAQNVILTDTIPGSLTNVEFSSDYGVTWWSWNDYISLGILAAYDSATVLIRGRVAAGTVGNITNTAFVTSSTPDPYPANNFATANTYVPCPELPDQPRPRPPRPPHPKKSADLAVIKSACQSKVKSGEEITYTITVFNNGPDTARDVTLEDDLPREIRNPQYSINDGRTWQPWPWQGFIHLRDIFAGDYVTVLIKGTLVYSNCNTIRNTALVCSSTFDPNFSNNCFTVTTTVMGHK